MSHPKGGGAIRGIGKKFAVTSFTGTSSPSVPLYIARSCSGFNPQLSLSYDHRTGNGPFGLGWNLALPSITRKTEKVLPKYNDDEESDNFSLSGAEDLIPVLVEVGGQWKRDIIVRTVDGTEYRITRYRSRIEGLFARIELWTNLQSGETHWRSISRDDVISLFGRTIKSRIFDPTNPQHVFSWLVCESRNDKGNAILYEYKVENDQGIDISKANERNRLRTANRYIKRIRYGNRKPLLLDTNEISFRKPHTEQTDFRSAVWIRFEVVFDYGEHHDDNEKSQPISMPVRDEKHQWQVRRDPFSSYRAGFEVRTYRLCRRVLLFSRSQDGQGIHDCPVRSTNITYTESPATSLIIGITRSRYIRWADGMYLEKPMSQFNFSYTQATIHCEVKEIDASSIEQPQMVDQPARALDLVDLSGDGLADLARLGCISLPSHPKQHRDEWFTYAFKEEERARDALDQGRKSVYLADMSGDGLTDLVSIRNGEVCYLPNLGYGRFGDKVTMDNAPLFDTTDEFDQKRILLADVDGSGFVDIVYVGREDVRVYFNQSGNSWSDVVLVYSHPLVDDLSSIRVVDLFGSGTACLVWSSPIPQFGLHLFPMRYIDLMGGQKPRLLVSAERMNSTTCIGTSQQKHF